MQCEVKEAVNQNRKTSSHGAGGHTSPEFITRVSPGKSHTKQIHDKEQTNHGAYDPAIRQNLQIIVMGLLKSIHSIAGVVARINHTKRT
jgi:hypothetical protein